jgi:hypothetical protein
MPAFQNVKCGTYVHINSTVHSSLHRFKTFYESYDLWKQFSPATQVRFYNVFHPD